MNRWVFRAVVIVVFVGVPAWIVAVGIRMFPYTEMGTALPFWAKVAPEQIAEAEKHGVPVAFENDIGMRFVLIPAGTFTMGSPLTEEGRQEDEAAMVPLDQVVQDIRERLETSKF